MKTLIKTIKLLCLMPLLLAIQCDDDVTEETYYIEGKWLLANAGGSELPPNTMYEFKDGLRYIYYCGDDETTNCDDAYWSALETSDAIPNPDTFSFEPNVLIIDGDMLFDIEFDCNGDVVNVIFPDSVWQWWRIGTSPTDCE